VITVSDFITPHFYDPLVTAGTRYSFTGSIKAPRQILPGGYISWINQQTDEMQQLLWVDPNRPPTIRDLGSVKSGSLRVWIDAEMHKNFGKATVRDPKNKIMNAPLMECARAKRANLDRISVARAKLY
jgi:hypothetical protein